MAVSNILQNPFANARNTGTQFADNQNKQSPNLKDNNLKDNNQNKGPTNTNENPDFVPPNGDNNNQNNNNNQNRDDPMSNFETLWDDPVVDEKNPPKEFEGYLPNIDQTKFAENVGKMDFSKAIKPETMASILEGGEKAAAAYPDLINSIGRQAFTMAFNASTKMTNAAATNIEKRFMDDLIPNSIQNRIVDDTLTQDNALASNPKFAPIYKGVKAQFQKKFPKASPQQISQAVAKYMQDYHTELSPKKVEDDNTKKLQKGSGDADWESWINPNQTQA